MINFTADLIKPVENRLNSELLATTGQGAFIYKVNDKPRNFRYRFNFLTDAGELEHEYKEREGMHDVVVVPINAITSVNPQTLDGAVSGAYNALVDASIRIILPIHQLRGTALEAFLEEFRRLVDGALQSSESYLVPDPDGAIYHINTQYSLLQTGARDIRGSIGDSVEFLLSLSFAIVASGIASDSIELTIDGERIYAQRVGFSRKSVKEMGVTSEAGHTNSQKSFETATLFALSFDLPARFSSNGQSTSLNEKIAAFTLGGDNPAMLVEVKYPVSIALNSEGEPVTTSNTYAYSMKFDTGGINGETGLAASHSITLMEV